MVALTTFKEMETRLLRQPLQGPTSVSPPVVLEDAQNTLGILWNPRQVNASDDKKFACGVSILQDIRTCIFQEQDWKTGHGRNTGWGIGNVYSGLSLHCTIYLIHQSINITRSAVQVIWMCIHSHYLLLQWHDVWLWSHRYNLRFGRIRISVFVLLSKSVLESLTPPCLYIPLGNPQSF